jgi:hypothetical protein
MIPWDLDNSFSGAIMGWDYWSQSNIYEYDPYFTGPNLGGATQPWDERPLLYKLLNNNHYRKIYTAHINTIIEESLDTNIIRANIDNLQNIAFSAAVQDNNKVFTMNEYYENVNNAIWASFSWGFGGILNTINQRKEFLLNHPEISLVAPDINNLTLTNDLVTVEIFNADIVNLMVTTSEYNSRFESFLMYDDGSNGDITANDGIYSAILAHYSSGLDVKFYVKAENNDAIKLHPQRAEYEFFIYSPISEVISINPNLRRNLISIKDVLGKEVAEVKNTPLFYIYDDGSVERRIILK